MEKFVIIDGNAIVHRAYHAIPPLTDKKGRVVNAVYGFSSMLLKVWDQIQPKYMAVTFDMPGKTFRHEKYTEYKGTRVKADQDLYDQIPLCHEVVQAFNIPIFEKAGFEADDVIGTISKYPDLIKENIETYIVTGDMDTLQLVDENIKVYTLRKGMSDVVIYDIDKVKERFQFGPEKVVDYKALRGDSSDNIPGVRGIGEKTATQLILAYGSIEKMYSELEKQGDDIDLKKGVIAKLRENKENAFMSKELATIDLNVPKLNFKISDCVLSEYNKEEVLKLFQEFEFTSLLRRVPGMRESVKEEDVIKKESVFKKSIEVKEISSNKEIEEVLKIIEKEKTFSAQQILRDKTELLGIIVVTNSAGYWIEKKYINKFENIFENKDIELIGHDLKQLVKALLKENIEIKNILFDIQIASYLLNPGSRSHDPASIILKNLGKELPAGSGQESLFGANYTSKAQEIFLLQQCAKTLKENLDKINNLGLFREIEMPLVNVLAEIENNGVAIDEKKLKELSVEVNNRIAKLTKKIHKLAGEEFNIASTLQLREILFEKLELPTQGMKKGKTGYSTNAETLEKLHDIHPIIKHIEEFREMTKLQNTYIDVLPTLVNKETKRIHAKFNQAVTATGRLSSSDPNLQNIPIRTELGREIRKSFVSQKGYSLVVADYSQIELRIVASLAKDKKMMEIFSNDLDIHKATAAAINGVKLEDVTKEMRRAAKEVNFGVLYGMGSYGLSNRTGIPVWQAKEFITKYFESFKDVKKYIDTNLKFTQKEGYCETLFGRRRYLPELNSHNFQVRSSAERMAINHPIQGTAADLMKMAMISVQKELKKQFKSGETMMILQVHDELVIEVKKGLEEKVSKLIQKTMEEVVKLNVPVKVDVDSGTRWGEIK